MSCTLPQCEPELVRPWCRVLHWCAAPVTVAPVVGAPLPCLVVPRTCELGVSESGQPCICACCHSRYPASTYPASDHLATASLSNTQTIVHWAASSGRVQILSAATSAHSPLQALLEHRLVVVVIVRGVPGDKRVETEPYTQLVHQHHGPCPTNPSDC